MVHVTGQIIGGNGVGEMGTHQPHAQIQKGGPTFLKLIRGSKYQILAGVPILTQQ